jgi:hypothetical protein
MTVTLDLPSELVQRLNEQAARHGKTLEMYLKDVAKQAAEASNSTFDDRRNLQTELTPEQWATELRAWATSHKPVNHFVDDSRDSIYAGRGE